MPQNTNPITALMPKILAQKMALKQGAGTSPGGIPGAYNMGGKMLPSFFPNPHMPGAVPLTNAVPGTPGFLEAVRAAQVAAQGPGGIMPGQGAVNPGAIRGALATLPGGGGGVGTPPGTPPVANPGVLAPQAPAAVVPNPAVVLGGAVPPTVQNAGVGAPAFPGAPGVAGRRMPRRPGSQRLQDILAARGAGTNVAPGIAGLAALLTGRQ